MSKHFALGGHKFRTADLLSLFTTHAIDGHRSVREVRGRGGRVSEKETQAGNRSRKSGDSHAASADSGAVPRRVKTLQPAKGEGKGRSNGMKGHPMIIRASFHSTATSACASTRGHKISRVASRSRISSLRPRVQNPETPGMENPETPGMENPSAELFVQRTSRVDHPSQRKHRRNALEKPKRRDRRIATSSSRIDGIRVSVSACQVRS